jgi:PAS domain-containing protein
MKQRRLPASTDRDQLRQIVSGSTEGVILIERGHKVIWANAAACAMHGVDGAGLGRTIGEYRKRFELQYRNHRKLAPASYPLARAAAGETFADVVVEVTSVAQPDVVRVHRVRSLAVTDANGAPDLYVLFLTDVTDWASAEQRFEKAFGANPAPALICHLGDLRYIKVNRGFLEMTGHASDAVVGLPSPSAARCSRSSRVRSGISPLSRSNATGPPRSNGFGRDSSALNVGPRSGSGFVSTVRAG